MMGFLVGDSVRVSAAFTNAAGAATDPTTVTVRARGASFSGEESFVYLTDAEVVKDSTGNYHADFTMSGAGKHFFRVIGSGDVAAAGEVEVSVTASEFASP